MKRSSVIFKLSAVALALVYVLSIGGINIHSCSHTGQKYVTFLFENLSCEQIHTHDFHECDGDDDCCSNEAHFLGLTGDDEHETFQCRLVCFFDLAVVEPIATLAFAPEVSERSYIPFDYHIPDIPDCLFTVLRV